MSDENRNIVLALDSETERLLEAAVALSGVGVEKFCLAAIEEKAARTVFPDGRTSTFTEESEERLFSLRDEIFQGHGSSTDTAGLIREDGERRREDVEPLTKLFAECDLITQGRGSGTDAADLIREAREERHRDAEENGCA